jgi:hypothetical protein
MNPIYIKLALGICAIVILAIMAWPQVRDYMRYDNDADWPGAA